MKVIRSLMCKRSSLQACRKSVNILQKHTETVKDKRCLLIPTKALQNKQDGYIASRIMIFLTTQNPGISRIGLKSGKSKQKLSWLELLNRLCSLSTNCLSVSYTGKRE